MVWKPLLSNPISCFHMINCLFRWHQILFKIIFIHWNLTYMRVCSVSVYFVFFKVVWLPWNEGDWMFSRNKSRLRNAYNSRIVWLYWVVIIIQQPGEGLLFQGFIESKSQSVKLFQRRPFPPLWFSVMGHSRRAQAFKAARIVNPVSIKCFLSFKFIRNSRITN